MVITRPAVTVLVVCLVGVCGLAASPATTKAKQAAAKSRTATKVSSARKGVAKRPLAARVAYRKPAPYKPVAPSAPASNRLREVQLALIDRGYLQGDGNGAWNAQCVEALKHFETDQKVRVDGRIDSKMLIALGLGPKYDNNLNLPVPSGSTGTVVAADQSNNNEQPRE